MSPVVMTLLALLASRQSGQGGGLGGMLGGQGGGGLGGLLGGRRPGRSPGSVRPQRSRRQAAVLDRPGRQPSDCAERTRGDPRRRHRGPPVGRDRHGARRPVERARGRPARRRRQADPAGPDADRRRDDGTGSAPAFVPAGSCRRAKRRCGGPPGQASSTKGASGLPGSHRIHRRVRAAPPLVPGVLGSAACPIRERRGAAQPDGGCAGQPRPTNGILVAITVMNCTLASSGSPAM